MPQTARYNAERNILEELPQMEKPICINGVSPNLCSSIKKSSGLKECECLIYENHIASLRTIPCDPLVKDYFVNRKEYVEGVGYKVITCCNNQCNQTCELTKAKVWAVPLQPVQSEDDLWKEALSCLVNNPSLNYNSQIAQLKKEYHLTRKIKQ